MAKVVIKSSTVFFFLCMFLSAQNIMAQQARNPMFYKEIQLDHKSSTFDALTREIQLQSGITFSYNASKINPPKHFRVKAQRITVEKLLAFIKKRSGIGYKILNDNHIIYLPPKNKKHPKTVKTTPAPKKENTRKAPNVSETQADVATKKAIPAEKKDNSTPQQIVVIGDTAVASSYYLSGGGSGIGTIQMIQRYPGEKGAWQSRYASLNGSGNSNAFGSMNNYNDAITSFLKENVLLSAGLSADEIYYFNPTLHFGFTWLHVLLSYNTGAFSQFRYGLGTEAKLNDKWSLRLSFNTGKPFQKQYTFPVSDTIILPPPDSISPPQQVVEQHNVPIIVKSKLTRFTLSVAWNINTSISLSGGATLNYLKTTYSSRGAPFNLNALPGPVLDAENRYRTIKPPYVLVNTYSNGNATDTKIWIGFQLTLLYRLSFFK